MSQATRGLGPYLCSQEKVRATPQCTPAVTRQRPDAQVCRPLSWTPLPANSLAMLPHPGCASLSWPLASTSPWSERPTAHCGGPCLPALARHRAGLSPPGGVCRGTSIPPLAWEPPHAAGAALEKAKRQKQTNKQKLFNEHVHVYGTNPGPNLLYYKRD